MYFPDQHRALVEMKRVLVPGGRVAVIVFAPADKNGFFSIPVSIVRRHANLGPPLPGQPGPFSLGAAGVIEDAFTRAGFRDVKAETIDAPVRLPSVAECVRFEQESFGALHQMLTGLSPAAREAAWQEVATALRAFEVDGRFVGACQLVVAVGTN